MQTDSPVKREDGLVFIKGAENFTSWTEGSSAKQITEAACVFHQCLYGMLRFFVLQRLTSQ